MMDVIMSDEAIERLKEDWISDPCWDIENTEGFGFYRAMLLDFRREQEAKWEAAAKAKKEAKIRKSKEIMQKLNDLAIGESMRYSGDSWATRVPTGFIIEYWEIFGSGLDASHRVSAAVFVPWEDRNERG